MRWLAVGLMISFLGWSWGQRPPQERSGASIAKPRSPAVAATAVPPAEAAPVMEAATWAWSSAAFEDSPEAPHLDPPVRIRIPSLDIEAAIVEVGVEDNGEMSVPSRPDEAGWYRFGARPGDTGAAVIAGHVDAAGWGPGAFFHLDRLTPGDVVTIEFADGETRSFEVRTSQQMSKRALNTDAVFESDEAVVRLVTCGGSFDQSSRHYSDNVVVELVPG